MRFLIFLLILASPLRADTLAGAWETFPTKENADAWSLFAYGDLITTGAPWASPDLDENPYAYSFFLGGEGVWFYGDGDTANGAFVGDFGEQKISGVDVSVNIDPQELNFLDLTVDADGPQGAGYYYSLIYQPEDLGDYPDWYILNFAFDDDWFYFQNGEAIAFKPDQTFLASIRQIGVRIFPASGVTGDSYVGVDDFILVPTVEGPALSTSLSGGNFVLDFTLNPGVSATIEKLTPGLTWKAVIGQSGLTGSQSYTRRVMPGSAIFRVAAEEKLTKVTSP